MDNVNEQLDEFAALVLRDANEKRESLINKTEAEYKQIIDDKENEYLKESYEAIQRSKSEFEHEADEEMHHAEMEAKKKVLLKREEIIDDIMNMAKERLRGFTKSDAYGEWLVKKAEDALREAGKGNKIIYVSRNDMRYADSLKAAVGADTEVESVADAGFIGGLRVYNAERRVSVDYSFGELLSDEKQSFLQNSGLVIR